MDRIYPVRPGDDNDELRWSLRSMVANHPLRPDDRVWIVGYRPSWLTNVEYLPGNLGSNAQQNVYGNIRIGCSHDQISDQVEIWNDDFFAMQPADQIPPEWRCTLAEHLDRLGSRKTWWWKSLDIAGRWLRSNGYQEPLSYELHRPIVADRHNMAQVLTDASRVQPQNPPQWRTLYGNRWQIGGTQTDDAKIYRRDTLDTWDRGPWCSTVDGSFRSDNIGRLIRDTFPDRSPFER